MELNHPELTLAALKILRSGENFQWYIIPILALVVYVYSNEAAAKNWRGIASGLCLYSIHWFFEILNGLIQHFSGHALWTVSAGTSYLILIGVGIEISMMFSIAGLAASKLLPEDPQEKILGINSRLFNGIANAALFSIIEIFLAKETGIFTWVYPWWGAFPVFITVYIPFFVPAMYCYDWDRKKQKQFIGGMFLLDAVLLFLFVYVLKWI
ncbi:MAG TPA: hypothetical protein PKA14_25750 [Leptospiraceae bacterium]|nr:hypothetical protein [Leptospiraceae bacterium]